MQFGFDRGRMNADLLYDARNQAFLLLHEAQKHMNRLNTRMVMFGSGTLSGEDCLLRSVGITSKVHRASK